MSKTKLFSMLTTLMCALVGVYVLLVVLLYLLQSHFVYFPEREILSTPHEMKLPYDAISMKTDDGVHLSGWFVPSDDEKGVILFCHGNAGNISNRMQYIDIFNRMGLSTFLFDYRGFGQSEGAPSEQGTYLDAKAAWDYLVEVRGIPPERIVIFGESLGGAVAAWLAQDRKPAALILQSTFTSLPDMAARLYPLLPARWLCRYRYDTVDYLSRVTSPLLVVQSCDDEIVPYRFGCELYELAKDPKEFLEIRGDHNTGFVISGDDYGDGIKRFVFKYLK